MRYSIAFALAATLLCATPITQSAHAASQTPLMVIRFNQPHVDYAMPLYNTISSALKAKPSATFDVVSIAPQAKNAGDQPHNNQLAEQNSQLVLGTLHEIGLPDSRISKSQAVDSVSVSEVRIFVH